MCVFFEKQVTVYIGSESPAIRFTSLRSVPAPVRFKTERSTYVNNRISFKMTQPTIWPLNEFK